MKMPGRRFSLILLLLTDGVFGDEVTVSVKEGDSVPLKTGVTKQQHDKILWYFNNTLIALINGHPDTSCLYDGEGGRFKDRLEVDYKSGSLTIKNIRHEHAGRYEAELIRSESLGKRQSLNRNKKCDSTKMIRKIRSTDDDTIKIFNVTITDKTNEESQIMERQSDLSSGPSEGSGPSSGSGPSAGSGPSSGAVAGIVVGVLVVFGAAAVAGGFYYRHRRPKNGRKHTEPVI